MNILVACEESQEVCKAFRAKGHEAYSCDIIEPSGGHPEWHILGDVLPILNPPNISLLSYPPKPMPISFNTMDGEYHEVERWDMIIAFPPCTDLTVTGARVFERKRADGSQGRSIEFFAQFLTANCDKVAIENPVGIISGKYIKKWFPDLCKKYDLPRSYSQIVHPWMFGASYSKKTCLWLKGLPELKPEIEEEPEQEWVEWVDKKTGKTKRQNKWYYECSCLPTKDRAKARSKTYPGFARAMAEQWG